MYIYNYICVEFIIEATSKHKNSRITTKGLKRSIFEVKPVAWNMSLRVSEFGLGFRHHRWQSHRQGAWSEVGCPKTERDGRVVGRYDRGGTEPTNSLNPSWWGQSCRFFCFFFGWEGKYGITRPLHYDFCHHWILWGFLNIFWTHTRNMCLNNRQISRSITCFPMFRPFMPETQGASIQYIYIFSMVSSSRNLYASIKLVDQTFGWSWRCKLPGDKCGLGFPGSLWHKETWGPQVNWYAKGMEKQMRYYTVFLNYYTSTILPLKYQRNLGAWSQQIDGSSSKFFSEKKVNTNRRTNFFHARRVTRFMTMMYAEVLPNTSGIAFGKRLLVVHG